MRKLLGPILLGLGAFLLVVGVMCVAWAPGQVKKVPLNINQTTHLSGTVQKIDVSTGTFPDTASPVKVESISKIDKNASDDKVAVWYSTSCAVIDTDNAPDCVDGNDPRLVSASDSTFATDRVTAIAVPDFKGLPAGTAKVEGLINKWPFDAKKKTYPYWDDTLGRTVPAKYVRTATLKGVKCYVYQITIDDEPIQIAEGTPGTYTNHQEIWVEPKTGAVQQQSQDQERLLQSGSPVLKLKIGFTPEQLKQSADDAKSNLRELNLLLVWLPIIGFVLGAVCIVVGLLLIAGRRRNGHATEDRELVGSSR